LFNEVVQQPGKRFWFGTHKNANTVVFSFPGNPVSTFANFHVYFRDWLHKSLGLPFYEKKVLLAHSIEFVGELTQFIGVQIKWENGCIFSSTVPINGPGDLIGLSKIDGFILLSPSKKLYQKGESVPFIPTRNTI
jgi:molybdopterin molybdotransferase